LKLGVEIIGFRSTVIWRTKPFFLQHTQKRKCSWSVSEVQNCTPYLQFTLAIYPCSTRAKV